MWSNILQAAVTGTGKSWRGLAPAAAIINGRTAAYPSTMDEIQQKRPNCTDYRYSSGLLE
jgi:hypothetical protein